MAQRPIEDHGIIGDLHTVALVDMDGDIDFLCFPSFDSPTVFAALLDEERGGSFRIRPSFDIGRNRQIYLPDTNILLTRFLSPQGVAEITDFMPVEEVGVAHNIVRRVKMVRGECHFHVLCDPRFDYGRADHRLEINGTTAIFTSLGDDGTVLRLRSQVPLRERDGAVIAEMDLRAGETADFILEQVEDGDDGAELPADFVREQLEETIGYWREWVARSTYGGRWRDVVNRSALTLKLLFSADHGSLVAAPTFGLPEEIGGERNWDYRYTWIRDAAFTLYTLTGLGHTAETDRFMLWVEKMCTDLPDPSSDRPPLQVLYGLDGRRDIPERTLDHLRGYRDSQPVRVGNAAYQQLQLDIYGELVDAIYLDDRFGTPISYELWTNVRQLVDWVAENWNQPDAGIWETRGGNRHFLHSRVQCWVAIDRAIRIATRRALPAPVERWRESRDAIFEDVHGNFWNEELGAFVQYAGGDGIDAASLLMPLARFISPTDPRWLSHLRAVEKELVDDSLVYRYRGEVATWDGLEGREGTFSMCSFWYVENLARAGRVYEARFYFEKMLGYANHLGLYGEELGPTGEHLGNFPQGFTHLGLISAALALDRALADRP